MSTSTRARKGSGAAAGANGAAMSSGQERMARSAPGSGPGGRMRGPTPSTQSVTGDRHLSRQLHVPDSIDAMDSTLDVIYGQSSSQPPSGNSTRAMLALHPGPYDAASAHRNKNPNSKHAPVGAFTTGLGVVDPITGTVISGYGRDDGPYAALSRSPPALNTRSQQPHGHETPSTGLRSPSRENAPPSAADSFGSPSKGPVFGPGSSTSNEMKARHHEVMFGVQEGEAYEDFAVGGKVSMDHDRRTSLNDAVSRNLTSTNRPPEMLPNLATDMAGGGKDSTYGHGPLRIVDPKDQREDLVNGMSGLALYGGGSSLGSPGSQQGGLGSTTFLEGTTAPSGRKYSSSRSHGGSPRLEEHGRDATLGTSSHRAVAGSNVSDQNGNKSGVRRNKSLVKRIKEMRDNPNMPYQGSDSDTEDTGLKPPSGRRPGAGTRSVSAGSGASSTYASSRKENRAGLMSAAAISEASRTTPPNRARSKSSVGPSFQPLGKTRTNASISEAQGSTQQPEEEGEKSPKPSLLQRVTSGRWRRKE